MAALYGSGAAAGFSPQQVDRMSIWQFNAAIAGWLKANSPEKDELTEEQRDELFAWLDATAATPRAAGYAYELTTTGGPDRRVTAITAAGQHVAAFVSLEQVLPDARNH